MSLLLFQSHGPPLPGWLSLDGGRVFVSPRFLEEARRRGWDTLEGAGGPPRGEVVRATPHRRTSREEGCFRKVHLQGWKGAGLRDRIRLQAGPSLSPARVEIFWGERLGRIRISTPVPLLLAEEGPGRGVSVLVTRAVEGGLPLDRREQAPSPLLLRELAALAARLHREGLVHRDFYANHLLLTPQGELYLADLQRVMEPRALFERWRVKDLAALLHSAPSGLGPTTKLRFLLLYARAAGIEGRGRGGKERIRSLARRILRKQARMAAHRPRWG